MDQEIMVVINSNNSVQLLGGYLLLSEEEHEFLLSSLKKGDQISLKLGVISNEGGKEQLASVSFTHVNPSWKDTSSFHDSLMALPGKPSYLDISH